MSSFIANSFFVSIHMNNNSLGRNKKNIGLLALRLGVGIAFVYQGWGKLSGMEGTISMFDTMGFPMAVFFAWLVALVEFVGGLAVIFGVFTRVAAKLLAIIMIVALLVVHTKQPFASALLPIALLGAILGLLGVGGGDWIVTKSVVDK